jgi:hypothetical protein
MGNGRVVLAIIDRVRKDTDGRFPVSIGLADGAATALRFTDAAARVLIAELRDALQADTPPMAEGPPILRGIPGITERMKRTGAEILAGAVEMSAEELVAAIYQAMALELNVVGRGDRL